MNDLLGVARDLQSFCDRRGWQSCLIGGIAVLRWGEPRVTRDVDLTLLTGFGHEEPLVLALLEQYGARISDAAGFARINRILLLESQEGVGIDISLAALPYEELMIQRASEFSFGPGLSLRTCSAEDLLVTKLFASRPIDVRDAESVALRHGNDVDWDYVELHLSPLVELKEDKEILKTLTRLRAGIER